LGRTSLEWRIQLGIFCPGELLGLERPILRVECPARALPKRRCGSKKKRIDSLFSQKSKKSFPKKREAHDFSVFAIVLKKEVFFLCSI
jgi:hypothetical protein